MTVFFIDEDQRVTFKDIGRKDEIHKWAKRLGANVYEMELTSQFRCNGSDGYLAWLDNSLGIRTTANEFLEHGEYDFRVFDDPNELYEQILVKNKKSNRARMVAGYCWDWNSKKDPKAFDISIPKHKFQMRWNLSSYASLWIIDPKSVTEAGCIHTCQGLELDYIGVIIGPDLVIRGGALVTVLNARSKMDQSLKGYKSLRSEDPVSADKLADTIIRNTYRTLMTRGMKGCFIYCTDPETNQYFRQRVRLSTYSPHISKSLVASKKAKYKSKKK